MLKYAPTRISYVSPSWTVKVFTKDAELREFARPMHRCDDLVAVGPKEQGSTFGWGYKSLIHSGKVLYICKTTLN